MAVGGIVGVLVGVGASVAVTVGVLVGGDGSAAVAVGGIVGTLVGLEVPRSAITEASSVVDIPGPAEASVSVVTFAETVGEAEDGNGSRVVSVGSAAIATAWEVGIAVGVKVGKGVRVKVGKWVRMTIRSGADRDVGPARTHARLISIRMTKAVRWSKPRGKWTDLY